VVDSIKTPLTRLEPDRNPRPRQRRRAPTLWRFSIIAALLGIGFLLSVAVAVQGERGGYSARLTQQTGAATLAAAGRTAADMAGVKAALDLLVASIAATELRFSGVANGLAAPLALAMDQDLVFAAEIREAGGEIIARQGAGTAAFPPFSRLFTATDPDTEIIVHRPRPAVATGGFFAVQRLAADRAGRRVSVVLLVAVEALRLALPHDHEGDVAGMLLATTGGNILAARGDPFAGLRVTEGPIFAALPQSYRTLLPGEVRSYRARVGAAGPQRIFSYAAVAGWPLLVITASAPRFGWGFAEGLGSRLVTIVAPVTVTLLLFLLFMSARWTIHRRQLSRLEKNLRQTRVALRAIDAGVIIWEHGADSVYISSSWKRMLGYGREEVGDQLEEWINRIHFQDRPGALEGMQAVIDGSVSTHRHKVRMMSKDGSVRQIAGTISAVRGRATDPLTIVVTQVDMAALSSRAEPARTPQPVRRHKVA